MADSFKMNFALRGITEADYAADVLAHARAAGINIMQWAPYEGPYQPHNDSAIVFQKYGGANFIRLQAEGDTLNWYWENAPNPWCYNDILMGTFVRQGDTANGRPVLHTTLPLTVALHGGSIHTRADPAIPFTF